MNKKTDILVVKLILPTPNFFSKPSIGDKHNHRANFNLFIL